MPSITLRRSLLKTKGAGAQYEVGKVVTPLGGMSTTTINALDAATPPAAKVGQSGAYIVELPALGLKQKIASAVSVDDAWQQFARANGITACENTAIILQL